MTEPQKPPNPQPFLVSKNLKKGLDDPCPVLPVGGLLVLHSIFCRHQERESRLPVKIRILPVLIWLVGFILPLPPRARLTAADDGFVDFKPSSSYYSFAY
jgi:hypothetical protein